MPGVVGSAASLTTTRQVPERVGAGNNRMVSHKGCLPPCSRGFTASREAVASQRWVQRGRACRANSNQHSHPQYQERLREAAADLEFSRLLSGADLGKRRARSATDAGVLRRKGYALSVCD